MKDEINIKKWIRNIRMKNDTESILNSTRNILNTGHFYWGNGKRIFLNISPEVMKTKVLLPFEIYEYFDSYESKKRISNSKCKITVKKVDTLQAARMFYEAGKENVIVLNFANPIEPGGGIRRGAIAQEESLCMRTTLLLSLENKNAEAYYQYNQALKNVLAASDAVIVSKNVQVFRNPDYKLIENPFVIDVITAAAPLVSPFSHCLDGVSEIQMQQLWFQRIVSIMLSMIMNSCSTNVVLGAIGCGAYGNSPNLVSNAFKEVFEKIRIDNFFEEITFAILGEENFRIFNETFKEKNDE